MFTLPIVRLPLALSKDLRPLPPPDAGPRVPTVDDLVRVFDEIDRVTETHRRIAARSED